MSVLASCIMPSSRGPAFVERAVRSFQAQTYGQKDLVVLRALDAEDMLDLLGGCEPIVHFRRVPSGLSIGELRNVSCRIASGSVLLNFDDDDVSAPDRIARSVEALKTADVVGSSLVHFVDPVAKRRWLWDGKNYPAEYGMEVRLYGATLAYRRERWERCNFDPWLPTGEDVEWLRRAGYLEHEKWQHEGPSPSPTGITIFHDLRDPRLVTCTITPDGPEANTCAKYVDQPQFTEIDWEDTP